MKVFLAGIAMTIAIPAAAQNAQPATDPHAGHQMPAQHGKGDGKAGHEGMDCCCDKTKMVQDKMAKGKMDCCDKPAKAADAHAGHDMSKH